MWKSEGCLQKSTARITHKILSTGSYTPGLGCLVWTRYQGKHYLTLWVITAYIPCITKISGVQTAYRQHQLYLDRTKDVRPSRHAMLEDLCKYTTQWREIGEYIFLMIELNKKIKSDTVTEIFASIGLMEDINHRHSATGMVPTYQSVSDPIDGIYTPSTIQVPTGSYLPFGIIPLYHRLLWLKIEFDYAFGATMNTLVPHTAHRLNYKKSQHSTTIHRNQ